MTTANGFCYEHRLGKFSRKVDYLYESEDIGENALLNPIYRRVGSMYADQDSHFICLEYKDFQAHQDNDSIDKQKKFL